MFCRHCGKEIGDTAVFCPYCGQRQDGFFSGSNEVGSKLLSRKKTIPSFHPNWGILKPICMILIFICILAVTASLSRTDEDKAMKTVHTFFEAVKAGDTEGALECFTPAFQQQYGAALKLGGMITSYFELPDTSGLFNSFAGLADAYTYQNYKFNVESASLNDDKTQGTVHVAIYVDGKIKGSTNINVVKYNGKWYVAY